MKRKLTLFVPAGIAMFVLFALMLGFAGRYNFCYIEGWSTFVYDAALQSRVVAQIGGCAEMLSHFLIQFFALPTGGVLITAALLTAIVLLTADILRLISESRRAMPLALLPAIALFFLQYNVNFLYSGTVAFLLMMICLRLQFMFRKFSERFAFSLASTLLLFVAAGAIAALYSLLLAIAEAAKNRKRGLWYAVIPLTVLLLSVVALRVGAVGELRHILLPDGYFTHRLRPGSVIYLPWGVTLLVFLVGGVCRHVRLQRRWMQVSVLVAEIAAAAVFASDGASRYIDTSNEVFKELNHYAHFSQWDKMLERCKSVSLGNLLFQNYRNMALSEECLLADSLFTQPCVDIRTIYVQSNKTPYISAMLSDIFFSMGHMAFAMRYAFEANEAVGNYSPRMLQRLTQVNLIYGHYGTAKKYLDVLSHTLSYKSWAEAHKRFLWNDAAVEADPVLGTKRRCIFADNRFAGTRGLDDDLKQIVLANPQHKATIQYLGSLYLLSKDLPRFKDMLETFFCTEALPAVLPVAFQEAVAVFADGDAEALRHYNVSPQTIERYAAFKRKSLRDRRNLWHFLKYTK